MAHKQHRACDARPLDGRVRDAEPEARGGGLRRGARRQEGKTPLHGAAWRGWEAGVRALLECKADVEARDKVRSGRGGLRFRAGKECQAVVFSKGSAECGRERSRISAA